MRSLVVALAVLVGLTGCEQVQNIASDAMTTFRTVNADWSTNATDFRENVGQRIVYNCPANGSFATVWGSTVYTDDSSVCTAGVHAGVISRQNGGRVVIEMRAGGQSYQGSSQNGVTTLNYGSWPGSFVVVRQ